MSKTTEQLQNLVKAELIDVTEATTKLAACRVSILGLEHAIKVQTVDANKVKVKQLKKELKAERKREKLLRKGLDQQINELSAAKYALINSQKEMV